MLVDLPTVTETYRTMDNVNIFKRYVFKKVMISHK